MSRTIILLVAVFALWLYFKYGNFSKGGTTVDKEGFSGSGGKF